MCSTGVLLLSVCGFFYQLLFTDEMYLNDVFMSHTKYDDSVSPTRCLLVVNRMAHEDRATRTGPRGPATTDVLCTCIDLER